MKIYQKHTIRIIEGIPARCVEYFVAKNTDAEMMHVFNGFEARTDDEDVEVYCLEVSKQTIKDEIAHCQELIDDWETKPNYPKVDVIIARQKNLIKFYKKILVKASK